MENQVLKSEGGATKFNGNQWKVVRPPKTSGPVTFFSDPAQNKSMEKSKNFNGSSPEIQWKLGVLYFSSFARVAPVKINELLRILVAGIWPASKTSTGVAF